MRWNAIVEPKSFFSYGSPLTSALCVQESVKDFGAYASCSCVTLRLLSKEPPPKTATIATMFIGRSAALRPTISGLMQRTTKKLAVDVGLASGRKRNTKAPITIIKRVPYPIVPSQQEHS